MTNQKLDPAEQQAIDEWINSIRPEWARMRQDGWIFTFDQSTKFLGAEHPDGGKVSIAEFRSSTLALQIAVMLPYILNDAQYPNAPA